MVVPFHLTETQRAFQPPLANGRGPPVAGTHRATCRRRLPVVLPAKPSQQGVAITPLECPGSPGSRCPRLHATPGDRAARVFSGEGESLLAESRLEPYAEVVCSWPRG